MYVCTSTRELQRTCRGNQEVTGYMHGQNPKYGRRRGNFTCVPQSSRLPVCTTEEQSMHANMSRYSI